MTYPPDLSSQPASPATAPVAPLTVPPLPASEPQAHRRFLANLPSWKLSVLLVGLLLYAIAHTLFTSSKPEERDVSDWTEKTLEAVKMTKLAFTRSGMHYVLTEPAPPPRPGSHPLSRPGKTSIRPSPGGETAISRWRELANSTQGRPYAWRRLGISLFVFGKPGGLDALRHVADPRKRPPSLTSSQRTRRIRRAESLSTTPLLPPAEEIALLRSMSPPRMP